MQYSRIKIRSCLLFIVLLASTAFSQPVKPHTFSPADPVSSAKMNANFDTIYQWGSVASAAIELHKLDTAAHGATGAVMGTTNAQTVTNKTLDNSNSVDGGAIKTGTVAEARIDSALARDSEVDAAYLKKSGGALTGKITGNAGEAQDALDLATYNNHANMRVIRNSSAFSDGMFIGYGNSGSAPTRVYGGGSTGNHLSVNASDMTFGGVGNTVWHAGNDGYGSGLDADTIHGISPTSFFNNMGQVHGTNPDFNQSGFGFRFFSNNTNGPGTGSQYYGLTLGLGSDYTFDQYASQLYWPRTPLGGNPYLSVRFRENGGWGAWSKIWAGYADSADYANFSGRTAFYDTRSVNHNGFDYHGISMHLKSNGTNGLYDGGAFNHVMHLTGWADGSGGRAHQLAFTDNDNVWIRGFGTAWGNWYKLWHSGNHGAGSGLDADALDGLDSSSFFRGDGGTYPNTDMNVTSQGFWHIAPGSANIPQDTYGFRWDWDYAKNNQWVAQFFSGTSGSDSLWFRQIRNCVPQSWQRLWSSTNDGAGSGLDADLLDGSHKDVFVHGDNTTKTTDISGSDINYWRPSGFYNGANVANTPNYSTWYHILHMRHTNPGNNHSADLIVDFWNHNEFYLRINVADSPSAWQKIWHSGNDGQNSGLVADQIPTSAPASPVDGQIWIE